MVITQRKSLIFVPVFILLVILGFVLFENNQTRVEGGSGFYERLINILNEDRLLKELVDDYFLNPDVQWIIAGDPTDKLLKYAQREGLTDPRTVQFYAELNHSTMCLQKAIDKLQINVTNLEGRSVAERQKNLMSIIKEFNEDVSVLDASLKNRASNLQFIVKKIPESDLILYLKSSHPDFDDIKLKEIVRKFRNDAKVTTVVNNLIESTEDTLKVLNDVRQNQKGTRWDQIVFYFQGKRSGAALIDPQTRTFRDLYLKKKWLGTTIFSIAAYFICEQCLRAATGVPPSLTEEQITPPSITPPPTDKPLPDLSE